eukprot:NODE_1339_length_899_cov_36.756477_g1293_i0.p1 GENE.NODE_1339_length_899_cov_36.756477_g1293_i0~~NODE_1339_length_899_cov_36.756477_g1293_i0.p1  ORF type:complete len:257 (-),score=2.93 NODE_1339_length_899_cov_36.756477_g1293_i0:38-808(-)
MSKPILAISFSLSSPSSSFSHLIHSPNVIRDPHRGVNQMRKRRRRRRKRKRYRKDWFRHLEDMDAMLFVIDHHDVDRLPEAAEILHSLLSDTANQLPVLIVLNQTSPRPPPSFAELGSKLALCMDIFSPSSKEKSSNASIWAAGDFGQVAKSCLHIIGGLFKKRNYRSVFCNTAYCFLALRWAASHQHDRATRGKKTTRNAVGMLHEMDELFPVIWAYVPPLTLDAVPTNAIERTNVDLLWDWLRAVIRTSRSEGS